MNDRERIIDELERAFDGDPWHGPNLTSILSSVSAGDAAAHPLQGGHSIWEIVLHVSAWIDEVRERLAGKAPGDPSVGDWPPVVETTEAAWTLAKQNLSQLHALLIERLSSAPDELLGQIVGSPVRDRAEGSGTSFHVMLHGLVQHNVYHSAQIGMLQRMARGQAPLQTGSVGWVDLTVPDAEGLLPFYQAVVGWEPHPVEMGGYNDYSMNLPGTAKPAAGICWARGQNAALPPVWMIYLTVDNLDRAMERCVALGGAILAGAKGAPGQSRYCVIKDPAGAAAALYEPKRTGGS